MQYKGCISPCKQCSTRALGTNCDPDSLQRTTNGFLGVLCFNISLHAATPLLLFLSFTMTPHAAATHHGGRHETLQDKANTDGPNGIAAARGKESSSSPSSKDLDQLWQWNQHVPDAIYECIHDIISRQAACRAQDVAVQSWDGALTYGQVEAMSARVARDLRRRGVATGMVVPLCFEKSKWTVVALLGVMKTGAAFSLTDPSQPEARLRTIVEQTEATIMVTSTVQKSLGQAIIGEGQVVVDISQDYFDSDDTAADELLPPVDPNASMYVIFTSGSTGKPKGVVISHLSFTSGTLPRAAVVGYNETSRVFDFPSYAFDVSLDCMLCTLSVGGTVCVPSDERRVNDLSGVIRDFKTTLLAVTPSVARVLDADIIPSLEVLALGGEAVSSSDALAWGKTTGIVIGYGPSECTVGCTNNNTVSVSTGIGFGVGCVTWIVDPEDHNTLVPIGAVGELIIEGPVVGTGYLGEPEKTAQVFIEDPTWLLAGHGDVPGRKGRLYKTGDLVRYESNMLGSIEFVGRKDQQVKLRGQRVELTEVEHHVQSCLPAGIKVAAEVIKPENGVPSLIAFLSEPGCTSPDLFTDPSPTLAASLAAIDASLGAKVPRYMIPAAFITLNAMPSLVSGKLDRKRLREIGLSIPRSLLQSHDDNVPQDEPATAAEKNLSSAWIKVLGSVTVYRQSNFFNLGGDSLRAMRLVAAAREQLLALTVADIFTSPTLSGMASRCAAITNDSFSSSSSSIAPFSLLPSTWTESAAREAAAPFCSVSPQDIEDMYACSPLQEALMALSAKVKDAYISQRVIDFASADEASALVAAFERAHNNCAVLRTRIVQVPGYGLFQVVIQNDFTAARGDNLQAYLAADRADDMDLGKPLIRYALIQEAERVCFVLTTHHAVYDGWSMPLVVDRVNRAYSGEIVTRPAEFKHFIKYLNGMDRDASAAYWKKQLDGTHPLQFPQISHIGYQTSSDSLLESYVSLGKTPPSGTTMATIIRAAWAIVSSQYVHGNDVVFGETLTGRNAPIVGAEEIEGPMITTIPFRLTVDGDISVAEFLQTVQDQVIEQIPHEHYGLQHIRRLSPDALEACELRTGLVLHPRTGDEGAPDETYPTSKLVPASDEQAAQEALKFNTYALMLVCAIDTQGFAVMASFDSHTIDMPTMQRVLAKFETVAKGLCDKMGAPLSQFMDISSADEAALQPLYESASTQPILQDFPGADAAYIINPDSPSTPLAVSGVGELVLTGTNLTLPSISSPAWIPSPVIYKTGKMARYISSSIQLLSTPVPIAQPQNKKKISATSRKQRLLRALWSRVLSIPEQDISLDDSFFALGGDSISAMKLASEARSEGIKITVADMFGNKELFAMAKVSVEAAAPIAAAPIKPFSLLDSPETALKEIQGMLEDPSWAIRDVISTRPLQEIAVQATIVLPRFSLRYEVISFDTPIDVPRLHAACQALTTTFEILRTVFVTYKNKGYGVVLEDHPVQFEEHVVSGKPFEHTVKDVYNKDILTPMPLGSRFVKFLYISSPESASSALVFRISHAQYDEMCLPSMLQYLAAAYQSPTPPASATVPFSTYVHHIVPLLPASMAYWKTLLADSSISTIRPSLPLLERRHYAVERTIPITLRSNTTIATIPPAAWSLVLARRLQVRDVVFGEVVSGRSISDTPFAADKVAGPTWQYVPFRLSFTESWTVADLLAHVQLQHAQTSEHEILALDEIAPEVGWKPSHLVSDNEAATAEDKVDQTWWFDTVVHQAIQATKKLATAGDDFSSKLETVYLHEEPLREWKIQAYISPDNDTLTLEVVTFESWAPVAKELLDEVCDAAAFLMGDSQAKLFPESN